ncbi:hypothetical protein IWQ62_001918 [Dispira parvispora]|uniref:Uncharacterized protein n=1 Tax=Dispira parvispora TaxID=1520584 RepID=A0A9W8AR81_9FUNG|nr:hypothetical protein IWQ62_001918 [Dispira parvispora]
MDKVPETNELKFRIFSEQLFTRTRLVSDSQDKVLYAIKHKSTLSRKHLEDHETGQVFWCLKGCWGFVNEVDFVSVKLNRKWHLGGDHFHFEYDAVPYKWVPKSRWSKFSYQCFHRDSDELVAEFKYKHFSKTFGNVTIYPKENWPIRLTEFLIFSVMRIVEVQLREDRSSGGGGGGGDGG